MFTVKKTDPRDIIESIRATEKEISEAETALATMEGGAVDAVMNAPDRMAEASRQAVAVQAARFRLEALRKGRTKLEASLTAAAEAEIKDRAAKARSTLEKCKAGQAKALAELRNHAGAILAVMVQREGRASAGTLAVRTWNLSGARFGENAQGLQSLRAEAEGGDPLAVALVKCLNDGSLDKLPDFAADGQAAELFLQNPPTVGAVLEAWNAPTPTPAQIERAAKLDAASKRLDAARDAEKRARADLDQAEMMRGGTPGTIQRNLAAAEAEHKKAVAAVASAEAEVGGLGA